MRTDNVSRGLLAAILVCLVLLIVEHRGAGESPPDTAPAPVLDRFALIPVFMRRGPPLLVRTDTATGEAWRMGLMAESKWIPLAEGEDGVPAPGAVVPGRFSISPHNQTRGDPTLVRHDSVTGRIWRKGSRTKRAWVPVPNPVSGAPDEAAPASAEGLGAEEGTADEDLDDEAETDPDAY